MRCDVDEMDPRPADLSTEPLGAAQDAEALIQGPQRHGAPSRAVAVHREIAWRYVPSLGAPTSIHELARVPRPPSGVGGPQHELITGPRGHEGDGDAAVARPRDGVLAGDLHCS